MGSVNRSNTKALYKYLAREVRGNEMGVTATEIAPITEDGRNIVGGWHKSEALAKHFSAKMTAKREERGEFNAEMEADGVPLPHFRERIGDDIQEISRLEVDKAVHGLAVGRAPGPDGFPAILYKKLPVLREVLVLIFNAIMRTGRFPVVVTRIILVHF